MTPQEQIDHERHIAEILKLREARAEEKSALDMWLNSNVLTAVIGVLGTALLGAWVSGIIQERSRTNELARSAQEATLASQNATVKQILERLSAFLTATDDLLATVDHAHTESGRRP